MTPQEPRKLVSLQTIRYILRICKTVKGLDNCQTEKIEKIELPPQETFAFLHSQSVLGQRIKRNEATFGLTTKQEHITNHTFHAHALCFFRICSAKGHLVHIDSSVVGAE